MNKLGRTVFAATLGCLICLVSGCASSHLADIWHDPSFQAPPLDNILVIALRKDATKRRIWEDAFAGEMTKHGINVTSSYHLFPDAPPDTAEILLSVQAHGFDGVLAVITLPTETEIQHVQGYTTTEQSVRNTPYHLPYRGVYWERYRTYYREIEHPGYVDSQSVDLRAIDVTTTGDGGRLIWSATSRTPDPGSVADVQKGIVNLVISGLVQRGIVNTR